MFCRARAIAIAASLLLIPAAARAQMIWQPAPAPLVTAENTTWFLAGDAVEWNGDVFYPGGASQFFNPFQMVRSGSFKGIPLYTDTTLQPNSIVFVPLSGRRMQPYERATPGRVAGTTGSRPPVVVTETGPYSAPSNGISRAAAPPTYAPAYEVITAAGDSDTTVMPSRPAAVGTSGRQAPVSTSAARAAATAPPARVTTPRPATVPNVWINFDGRRWFNAGKAINYDAAALTQVGTYYGWSVYTRKGDDSIIYIPATPGHLTPYRMR